ncbi:MAG: Sir2 silent information regulator family NAD-dependent deacetylase [Bacteroidales bacterium]|jgi:NAD-dependent SIR2 family protein deacetylase|nr:Sir2 silent information regulator family NAD-dependent deacetylase [Bacteroidales bacterium]MBR3799900.1 Sir2 silent information regulator family NAD-dependent deacetylase [Bacteroidales bacterium]MBR3946565.1 Sir2 silent information regulator family NAD-dependent deacetylase [Bacteroidales bacterium]MBR4583706.1 Sir2 silent information regulator family NAD-dependent deacetylase [Bacteroidales bacterium]
MEVEKLKYAILNSDAIVVGAGAGLSTSAGFTYSGERFQRYFSDFIEKYGFSDMYTAGFYSFATEEEKWAYWSRHIYYNRYVPAPKPVYENLLKLLKDKDYFVITTNVDHQFQKAGFDKQRLFYTQGDYGLFQCSKPCHQKTYDNEKLIIRMIAEQKNMRIPSSLVPRCPICGRKMDVNLRSDETFVEDDGWHAASKRYEDFINKHQDDKVLYLDLGCGSNTPIIFKVPFLKWTMQNINATYATINLGEAFTVEQIKDRSIVIDADVNEVFNRLLSNL